MNRCSGAGLARDQELADLNGTDVAAAGRAPITYVSRQLGHKDASITLRVYAHSWPDASNDKLVDALDDAKPDGPQTAPRPRGD